MKKLAVNVISVLGVCVMGGVYAADVYCPATITLDRPCTGTNYTSSGGAAIPASGEVTSGTCGTDKVTYSLIYAGVVPGLSSQLSCVYGTNDNQSTAIVTVQSDLAPDNAGCPSYPPSQPCYWNSLGQGGNLCGYPTTIGASLAVGCPFMSS